MDCTYFLNDYSLFKKGSGESLVLLAIYADDIILIEYDLVEIAALKSFLNFSFRIKDLRSLHYFLGIEVIYTSSGVLLHQRKFIHDLLKSFSSLDCSLVVCPLGLNNKLQARVGDPLSNPEDYRCLIGKFNFLTHTHPYIHFVVEHLNQFMKHPCAPHMSVALHLLHYLKSTINFGTFLSSSPDLSFVIYCESNW